MGRIGPTTAGDLPLAGSTPHVGIVPNGGAKEVDTPPSPLYRGAPCLVLHTVFSLLLSYLERGSDSGTSYEERSLSLVGTPPCY